METEAQYKRRHFMETQPDDGEVACFECNGAGYFVSDNGPSPHETDCGDCDGSGYVSDDAVLTPRVDALRRANVKIANVLADMLMKGVAA
jgi:DnaJ-class molecular chaperone